MRLFLTSAEKLGLGFRGAAIAISVTFYSQPVVFLAYVWFFNRAALQCWPGFDLRNAIGNWTPMIKLSLPGVVTVLAEWL